MEKLHGSAGGIAGCWGDTKGAFSPGEILEFCEKYEIPEILSKYAERLFSREEIRSALENGKNRFEVPEYEDAWLKEEYHRGFLNKTAEEGVFRLNNLYGMLDVFAVSRKEEYDSLFTICEKHEIDDWYFDTYYNGLTPDGQGRLTEDKVMTMEETIRSILQDPRPIYLNYCDCRSLTGDCKKPARTCLTYKNAPNSFVDRGLSQPLTKEEAVEIVKEADKKGLMHTTMSGGICNCCSDCCYLFRSQRRAGTYGLWPASAWIVSFDPEKCIGCGLCSRRCWLGVFSGKQDAISCDNTRCVGCGLCVNTCPKEALELIRREK